MSDIVRGDVVRARDWPGTHGKRFSVIRVLADGYAQVKDLESGKLRMIDVEHLYPDKAATRALGTR